MELLKGEAPFGCYSGRLQVLPVHIRLGWKGKQSSILRTLVNYGSKFFTAFGPGRKYFLSNTLVYYLKVEMTQPKVFVTSFLETGYPFLFPNITKNLTSGLYYKYFMILIYDHNDSDQYHKTRITIVIDNPSLS